MAESRNERLKKALKDSNVGHEKVGEILGKKRNTITERLNDAKEIDSVEFIIAVSNLTGRSTHYLYYGEEEPAIGTGPPPGIQLNVEGVKYNVHIGKIEELTAELEKLKYENEILRSALREIGSGINQGKKKP